MQSFVLSLHSVSIIFFFIIHFKKSTKVFPLSLIPQEEEEMALRIAQIIISDVNTMTRTGETMAQNKTSWPRSLVTVNCLITFLKLPVVVVGAVALYYVLSSFPANLTEGYLHNMFKVIHWNNVCCKQYKHAQAVFH